MTKWRKHPTTFKKFFFTFQENAREKKSTEVKLLHDFTNVTRYLYIIRICEGIKSFQKLKSYSVRSIKFLFFS